MNNSSTQVPFMIAGFIVVIIHSLTSESTIDNGVDAVNKVEPTTKVVMLDSARNNEMQKQVTR